MGLYFGLAIAGVVVLLLLIVGVMKCYKKVPNQGYAFIVNRTRDVIVLFTGGFIYPVIHKYETLDISRKTLFIRRKGQKDKFDDEAEGLLCKDNIRADIDVKFYIGINRKDEDILNVVKNLTVARAGNQEFLQQYFSPKFSEALKTAAKRFNFEELYTEREKFREEVKKIVGKDLDGYMLEDVVIDYLEQTALEAHNKDNILDVDGIKIIAERTAKRHIETNEILQDEETEIKAKNVSAEAARLNLDKQEQEAIAQQEREVRIFRAEQDAEAKKVEEQARTDKEKAIIKAQELIDIEQTNKDREVEVAVIAKDRITKIATEEVNRAEQTEVVRTEKEVEVARMDKEKTVENEMKEVAEITSQRVTIEQKTARAEEETLNIRNTEEANRHKVTRVTAAEAEAEADQVQKTVAAEADKKVAAQNLEIAELDSNAQLLRDEKAAQGKMKLAEATKKEESAKGLAEVEVRLANADAIEKEGLASAKAGVADADAIRARGEAEAEATEKMGVAKAAGAEAEYKAMESITEETRQQELQKLNIDKDLKVQLAEVEASKEISTNQTKVMSSAVENMKLELVGGETQFFDTMMKATSGAKAFDKRVQGSEVTTAFLGDYLSGDLNLTEDMMEVLRTNPNIGNMTIPQILANPQLTSQLMPVLQAIGAKKAQ